MDRLGMQMWAICQISQITKHVHTYDHEHHSLINSLDFIVHSCMHMLRVEHD